MADAPDPLADLRAWAAEAAFPREAAFRLPGLRGRATIRRDRHGGVLIEAERTDDLWFAQGFAAAGERCFQLELAIRAGTGRLSEVFGERTLDADRFARTVGLHLAGAAYVATWTDEDHAIHARFRAGARAWLERIPAPPLEHRLLGLDPWLPDDPEPWAACVAYLAWGLSNDHDQELLRAAIAERAGPEAVAALLPPVPSARTPAVPGRDGLDVTLPRRRPRGQGSNAWAVAGSRTAGGAPLLANDPHLLAMQPSPWLDVGLRAPGYEARGVALTFAPGVVIGATPRHAWGVTNVSGDVQDLFVERLDEAGAAAAFRGTWEPLAVREEAIEVRGEAEPRRHVVRESRHGPLLDRHERGLVRTIYPALAAPAGHAYALAWVGRHVGLRPSLPLHAARAEGFEAFRRVALEVGCPGLAFVYADAAGSIGVQWTGRHPVRARGDGTAPVPGWDGEHEWVGWVGPDDMPWEADPERGYVVTANDRPPGAAFLSNDFHEPHRARRAADLLGRRDDHDVGSMVAIQLDTVSLPARRLVPLLLERVGARNGPDGGRAALELLRTWDGDMAASSGAAAVLNVWLARIGRRALGPWLGDDVADAYLAWRERWVCAALPAMLEAGDPRVGPDVLAEALVDAVAELRDRLGDDPGSWRWGELHPATFAHPLAAIPGLEPLFVAARVPAGGDEQTLAQGGIDGAAGYAAAVVPSWRAVFDLGDPSRSVASLPTGNSGNPASPHWRDQVAEHAEGRPHPLHEAPLPGAVRLAPEAS